MTDIKASRPGAPGQAQKGFTLLELSIVLVVIGLIIGGVLKGQELIGSARVNSVQTDLNNIKTSANMFFAQQGEAISTGTASNFWSDIDSLGTISGIGDTSGTCGGKDNRCGPENPFGERYWYTSETIYFTGLSYDQAGNLDTKMDDGDLADGTLTEDGNCTDASCTLRYNLDL